MEDSFNFLLLFFALVSYGLLEFFVKSKNHKKVDAIFNRAIKALKTKEVKNISAII